MKTSLLRRAAWRFRERGSRVLNPSWGSRWRPLSTGLPKFDYELDYYHCLGVSSTATQAEIRAAFDDLQGGHREGYTKEQTDNAFEVLSNEMWRARYVAN